MSDLLTFTKSMFRRAEHAENEDGSTERKPRKLNGKKIYILEQQELIDTFLTNKKLQDV